MKLKNRIIETWKSVFQDITVPEYIIIWIVRLMLLWVVLFHHDPAEKVMCFVNMLSLYAMPLIRFAAPRKSFLFKLDYRCQHIIGFFELLGTFFGNYLNAYAYIFKYDRWLHFLSGIGVTIAGYYIYKATVTAAEGKKKSYNPAAGAITGMGFSFMVIVLWEITEFIGDFLYGTANQSYDGYAPASDDLWFKIFGTGYNGGTGQFPLWDTMMDMIDATIATLLTAILLGVTLTIIKKKTFKKEEAAKSAEQFSMV